MLAKPGSQCLQIHRTESLREFIEKILDIVVSYFQDVQNGNRRSLGVQHFEIFHSIRRKK